MTECGKYIDLISEAADLGLENYPKLKEHLESCENCRAYFDFCLASSDIISEETEPPETLVRNVMSSLPEKRKKNRWVGIVAAAACFILIIAAVPKLFDGNDSMASKMAKADSVVTEAVAEEACTDAYSNECVSEDDSAPAEETATESEAVTKSFDYDETFDSAASDKEFEETISAYGTCIIAYSVPSGIDENALISCSGFRYCEISDETAEALIREGYEAMINESKTGAVIIIKD